MAIHVANLLLVAIYDFLSSFGRGASRTNPRVRNKWLSRLVALQLIFILALRHPSVGSDVGQYMLHFLQDDADGPYGRRYEIGYKFLVASIRIFTDDPQVFLAIMAVLAIAPVAVFIERESPEPVMSWLLYICLQFYAFTFSGFRQSLAFGLTMLAFTYARSRQSVPFVLLVGAAALFHASALAFLPAYFLYRLRLRGPTAILYLMVAAVLFVFREELFGLFTSLFYDRYDVEASSSYTWLLMSAAILAAAFSRVKRVRVESPEPEGFFSIALVGVTLMIFASVGTNVMRMADYYYVAIIIALPLALETFEPQVRVLLRHFGVPAFAVVYLLLTYEAPYSIVPYVFFWQTA